MPIQCRTGCQEQVNYEHFPFPDGFVYFLPKNLDDSIHDCKNLHISPTIGTISFWKDDHIVDRKNVEIESWSPEEKNLQEKLSEKNASDLKDNLEIKNLIESTPNLYEFEYDGILNHGNIGGIEEFGVERIGYHSEDIKKRLLNVQMRCILFPTPFLSNPSLLGFSDLVDLSLQYEALKDFESAITARLIQDRITQDQSKFILELVNKQKNIKNNTEEVLVAKISATELRNHYYPKVENLLKSFIRKKYDIFSNLKHDFPKFCDYAEKLRIQSSQYAKHTHDDVIEFFTFGQCVKILKIKKIENNELSEKNEWNLIEWDIIQNAEFVKARRNELAHLTEEDIENSITTESKIVGHIFSKQIIDFFEKLDYS
jgi:hypothetical protein